MKNTILGLVIGLLIGFGASYLLQKTKAPDNAVEMQESSAVNNAVNTKKTADAKTIKTLSTELNSDNSSEDETTISRAEPKSLEDYQILVQNLQQAIVQQNKSVKTLSAENKKLKDSLDNAEGRQRPLQDLTAGQIEKAKENILASLGESPEEYAEVLKSALESYNSGDALPDADALLRHYADEPDFAWADVAKAYIQNYFAAQTDSNIQLVQLNCRKTYCELYGFYSSGEQLENPRQAGSQIQSLFNRMEDAPGFANLFTGLESASIRIDTENSYLTFHNFIRSNRQE